MVISTSISLVDESNPINHTFIPYYAYNVPKVKKLVNNVLRTGVLGDTIQYFDYSKLKGDKMKSLEPVHKKIKPLVIGRDGRYHEGSYYFSKQVCSSDEVIGFLIWDKHFDYNKNYLSVGPQCNNFIGKQLDYFQNARLGVFGNGNPIISKQDWMYHTLKTHKDRIHITEENNKESLDELIEFLECKKIILDFDFDFLKPAYYYYYYDVPKKEYNLGTKKDMKKYYTTKFKCSKRGFFAPNLPNHRWNNDNGLELKPALELAGYLANREDIDIKAVFMSGQGDVDYEIVSYFANLFLKSMSFSELTRVLCNKM